MSRDISGEATKFGACKDLHEHGRTVGVEEDLEVALTEQSRSSSPSVGVEEDLEVRRASPILATSMPARNLAGFRRTSCIRSQLPTYLEQFSARGTIASGTSAVKRNNDSIISSGKRSK